MAKPHARNLRKHRCSRRGRYYVITACCYRRRKLFRSATYCGALISQLAAADDDELTETYAYVVMPDHLHWMLELRTDKALSTIIQRVKARTTRELRRHHGTEGEVWQRGYHDRLVRSDDDLQALGDYIVHNPVRAGLVRRAEDYPFWDILWQRRDRA